MSYPEIRTIFKPFLGVKVLEIVIFDQLKVYYFYCWEGKLECVLLPKILLVTRVCMLWCRCGGCCGVGVEGVAV